MTLAPEDVICKTLGATNQMTMNGEAENCVTGRRHFKSRFGYIREHRIKKDFDSDTFLPRVQSNTDDNISQLFLGRKTDYMRFFPMNK